MWDDSYEESPVQVSKRKTNSIDYDASPPMPSRKSMGGGKGKSATGFDTDLLFSSGSENGSPVSSQRIDREANKRKKEFTLDDNIMGAPKSTNDYLSNFAANSNDLDDSILGGLLNTVGGPSKPKKDVMKNEAAKNELLNSSGDGPMISSSISPNINRPGRGSTSRRDRLQRQSGDSSVSPPKVSSSMPTVEFVPDRVLTATRGHFNSFDEDFAEALGGSATTVTPTVPSNNTASYSFPSTTLVRPPQGTGHTSAAGSRRGTATTRAETNDPPPIPTVTSALPVMHNTTAVAEENTPSESVSSKQSGFVPSFLDSGRQARPRRNLGATAMSMDSGLRANAAPDALDAMLGIGGPNSAPKKPFVDPFAAAEIKANAVAKSQVAMSDSDSDDLTSWRPRSRFDKPKLEPTKSQQDTVKSDKPTEERPATAPLSKAASWSAGNAQSTITQPAANGTTSVATHSASTSSVLGALPSLSSKPSSPLQVHGNTSSGFDAERQYAFDFSSTEDELDVSGIVKLDPTDTKPTVVTRERADSIANRITNNAPTFATASANSPKNSASKSNEVKASTTVIQSTQSIDDPSKKSTNSTFQSPDEKPRGIQLTRKPTSASRSRDKEKERDLLESSLDRSTSLSQSQSLSHPVLTINTTSASNTIATAATASSTNPLPDQSSTSSSVPSRVRSDSGPNNTHLMSPRNVASAVGTGLAKMTARDDEAEQSKQRQRELELELELEREKNKTRERERERLAAKQRDDESHRLQQEQLQEQERIRKQQQQDKEKVREEESRLQREIEAVRAERQRNEERHQQEMDALRNSVPLRTTALSSQSLLQGDPHTILHAEIIALDKEKLDYQRIINRLESECSRLKDEIALQALKHLQDNKVTQERQEIEMQDLQRKHEVELQALASRHSQAIDAIKRVHNEEIDSFKERIKAATSFENIVAQLKATSGSMKFVEDQLQQRQDRLELMKEGQFNARERLITEMEEAARERIQNAENESLRLKGIVSHLEHMLTASRTQSFEERERLAIESQRLSILQEQLVTERKVIHEENYQEKQRLVERIREVERDVQRFHDEKLLALQSLQEQQRKIDKEKSDLESSALRTKQSLELLESRIHDEEKKLQRSREEVSRERLLFEEYKLHCQEEVKEAEEVKQMLSVAMDNLQQRNEDMELQAYQLTQRAMAMQAAEEQLLAQKTSIEERERVLADSMVQLQNEVGRLTAQESLLSQSMIALQRKQERANALEHGLFAQRLQQAVQAREQFSHDSWAVANHVNEMSTNAHAFYQLPPTTPAAVAMSLVPLAPQQPQSTSPTQLPFHSLGNQDEVSHAVSSSVPSIISAQAGAYSFADTLPIPPQLTVHRQSPYVSHGRAASNENLHHNAANATNSGDSPPQPAKSWSEQFKQDLHNAFVSSGHKSSLSALQQRDNAMMLPKEVRLAQRTLRESHYQNTRANAASLASRRTLGTDHQYIASVLSTKKS